MKKIRATALLLAALCLLTLSLGSCAKKLEAVDNGGAYLDGGRDLKYLSAPGCYEALSFSEKKYAKSGKILFYLVGENSTGDWLCNSNGGVFYAEDVKLPTLSEMNITFMDVRNDVSSLLKIYDTAEILDIIEVYNSGERLYYPNLPADIRWDVRFADEDIGICYTFTYLELSEDYIVTDNDGTERNLGKSFFYDIYNGIFVSDGGTFDTIVSDYKAGLGGE